MTADMDRGFWSRLARTVMRRPALVAVVTGALLLALASPVLRIHFVGVSASSLPAGNTARTVAETIDREFPGIGGSTDVIVADGDTTTAQLSAAVARAVKAATGSSRRDVDVIPPAVHDGDLVTLDLPVRGDAETDSARELVRSLRTTLAHDNTIAFVGVTGPTSVTVDTLSSIRAHLPAAILMTFLSTFVLVFLFTGSLILPLKAIVMNTLSVAAAMSVLVLVFQDGRFEHLLNFTSLGGIESSQPVLIVALAFGLSTDYGIILLSRIREERAHAVDDREAVARAVQHTGRLITSAALLLCIAIGAFLTSRIIFIQQVGLGTVTAVLLDATIVRALLVPSLMALLGRWNWWAPGPMRRIHDRFGVREAQLPTPSAVRDVSGETAKSVFG